LNRVDYAKQISELENLMSSKVRPKIHTWP
jgi:hypothetical protein